MNRKELLSALASLLKDEPLPRKTPVQNLQKRPSRNTGKAQPLLGLSTSVPKKTYNAVVEHCMAEEITISLFLRNLIDAALDTETVVETTATKFIHKAKGRGRSPTQGLARNYSTADRKSRRTKHAPDAPPKKRGRKTVHSDEEIGEYIKLFHSENPEASAKEIFDHLRQQYGMKFAHTRAMKLLQKAKAEVTLNGKRENIG